MRDRPPYGAVLLGLALVLGGVACILSAVGLGFYMTHESAAVATANWRQANEMVAQHLRSGVSNYNVNVPTWDPPDHVAALMWSSFAAGVFMVASGLVAGIGRPRPPRPPKGPWPEV